MKTCNVCGQKKSIKDFRSRVMNNKTYVKGQCRCCELLRKKEYRKDPKVKEREKYILKQWKEKNKEHVKEYNRKAAKEYYNKHEKRREYMKRYGKKYKLTEKYKEQQRKYGIEYRKRDKVKTKHRKYMNKYKLNRRKIDSLFKFTDNLRNRIRMAFKRISNTKKPNHTFNMIGLSPKETMKYIESKFIGEMSWNNYGRGGWEIDHIIPLSSAKTKEELIKLCHYTNLQPLWAKDNLMKGNKIKV